MSYFPIYLNLEDKKILVVGGGNIALEKLEKIAQFTKDITVIAKEVKYNTYTFIKEHCLTYYQRAYRVGDIEGFDIVIVATDDISLQEYIYIESRGKGILVNSVDNTKYCDFIFPSFIKKGDLTISFSTSGASPAFARELRLYFEKIIPNSVVDFLSEIKSLREKLPKGKERMQKFDSMVKEYFKTNFK
jgi:precorrin-2 dehydrogenase/sirohydrochlorin ferrochelatase